MKITFKSSKLTYKTLFTYSLIIITLLIVAAPVLANARSGYNLVDFSTASDSDKSSKAAQPLGQGVNVDHLKAGEETWYVYRRDSFDNGTLSWISLAMRYESEGQILPDQVNFQVMAQKQRQSWLQSSEAPEEMLGRGIRSPLRTANRNLVEAFWTGQVSEDEVYYVRVFNHSPFSLDYTLEAQAEQPPVSGATPASLGSARESKSTLSDRQLAWSLTAQAVGHMNAEEAAAWMQKAQAVGWIITEGTGPEEIPTPRQANPQVLWALTAQAIAGQDPAATTEWLMQADSLGWLAIPLGALEQPAALAAIESGGDEPGDSRPAAAPVEPGDVYRPINIYPNNPLVFDLKDVNSGRLGPYGEHWYSLLRDDLDDELIEDMALTMFFTPREGYMSDRINFEIFPAGQYHIWARGDADYMEHFGLGLWVSRDEDPYTGERLWSGSLVDGDRYLIKVKNGTPDEVDYYLFPDDVENAELGAPWLHQSVSGSGNVPYMPAPPTRPGPPLLPAER